MIEATAPGKVILFGEHAVVYGRPAVAAPVSHVRAKAVIERIDEREVWLSAPDLGLQSRLSQAGPDDPLAAVLRLVQAQPNGIELTGLSLKVQSDIPIAGGLGSGAAISVAVIRALVAYLGLGETFDSERISQLAYEVERLHHGNPSGIDNTVIAYEQAVYFVRQEPQNHIEVFAPARPLRLLIADTGIRSATKDVVNDVRWQWTADQARFETIFDACGRIAESGRQAILAGDLLTVGQLMVENHEWLVRMTVSAPRLDRLVEAARQAGALGAKLSGAGRGGNVIALVNDSSEDQVREKLLATGAVAVLASDVG
jgi:mevalonate kinase